MILDEKKKVTIYSVANEAGVSLATVSRVINNSELVKEETRNKVEQAIIKLGYRPNAVAQGLALKKTTTIALVIPDSSFLYIGKTINGLLDVAKIYNYNIQLHASSSSLNEMKDIVDSVVKSRADGVIIYNEELSEDLVKTLDSFSIPVVYIGNKPANSKSCGLYIDYTKGIYELAKRYLDANVDDIILIQDRKNSVVNKQILDGLTQAFDNVGKKFNGYIQIPDDYHNCYDYLLDYFKNNKHQVVITVRDSHALAVLNACAKNGISIPDDSQLICVIDSRYIEMVRPQISSFEIPSYDLGALAMRVMTKMLNGNELNQNEYLMNYFFKNKTTTKL